jgi:uncharacterized membrane protein HdeD (DUF308 family)
MSRTAGTQPFGRQHLLHALARNWWLMLLRGICAIIFGLLSFAWPTGTLLALLFLYGAYAFVDGVFALGAAFMGGGEGPRWWLAAVGVLGIVAGLATFFWPGMTALVLLFFIAGWAIAIGVMQIVGAIQLRKEIDNEWMLAASGIISVVFGFVLIAQPVIGALSLVLVIGCYAVLYGMLLVFFSLRLRRHSISQ